MSNTRTAVRVERSARLGRDEAPGTSMRWEYYLAGEQPVLAVQTLGMLRVYFGLAAGINPGNYPQFTG
ncbi:MAG: hypothetical protein ACRDG3_10840 [Tepidiformaceae bacterium]